MIFMCLCAMLKLQVPNTEQLHCVGGWGT